MAKTELAGETRAFERRVRQIRFIEAKHFGAKCRYTLYLLLLYEFHDAWMNQKTDRTMLIDMLKPFPSLRMKKHPVSSSVNSPDNNSADLLLRVDAEVGKTPSLFN
jgi:hypothetical protein